MREDHALCPDPRRARGVRSFFAETVIRARNRGHEPCLVSRDGRSDLGGGLMLQVDAQRDTITITLDGRFDLRTVTEFKHVFTMSPRLWIIDLTRVDYVDSSALGVLLLLRERVDNDPQRVHLRGLRGQPKAVLMMAKFDRLFRML